ncbi:putative periplasmic binding protein-like I [Helianthus annuus]|uniref:Periplasmic binding protein-like I n=1 Tax=Helianthus annuus TaxID=4232 RepID=A0A9K3N5Q9_HELAN|nr:putative periplasmic binding protein-like I [Helianthus annuus]
MMEEGYVWIITEVLTSRLHLLDRVNLDSMHGVLGVKSYIPRSKELTDFEKRWKREFRDRNPKDDEMELDMFGIWWYDTVYGLAMALEKAGNDIDTTFRRKREPQTDLDAIGTSEMGSSLIPWIRNLTFKGLSGDFCIVNGQLQSSAYEVVNIIETRENHIGFWTRGNGISKKLNHRTNGLRAITWPGDSHVIPKGWEIPTNSKNVLKIGVPAKGLFVQFIDAKTDPETQQVIVTGFCVDVFNAVVSALPYAVKPEFIPFVTPDGKSPAGSYTDFLISNLSRFVVIVWVLVVLVLTSSYTASLTSMLTVEQLRPTHTDIDQIRRNGESVGYQKGSFVVGILKSIGFDDAKLKSYSTFEEYDRALQAGSRKGGVSAIMDELPYIRLFLAVYCNNYTMTNATYRTVGFGFVSSFYCVLFQDFISSLMVQTSRARAQ